MKKGDRDTRGEAISGWIREIHTALSDRPRKPASLQLAENMVKKHRDELAAAGEALLPFMKKETGNSRPSDAMQDLINKQKEIHKALGGAMETLRIERQRYGEIALKHRAGALQELKECGGEIFELANELAEALIDARKYLTANQLVEHYIEKDGPYIRSRALELRQRFR